VKSSFLSVISNPVSYQLIKVMMKKIQFGNIFAVVTLPTSFISLVTFSLLGILDRKSGALLPAIYMGVLPPCVAFVVGMGLGPILFQRVLTQWPCVLRGMIVLIIASAFWMGIGFLLGPIQRLIEGSADVPGAAMVLGYFIIVPVLCVVLVLGGLAGKLVYRATRAEPRLPT